MSAEKNGPLLGGNPHSLAFRSVYDTISCRTYRTVPRWPIAADDRQPKRGIAAWCIQDAAVSGAARIPTPLATLELREF